MGRLGIKDGFSLYSQSHNKPLTESFVEAMKVKKINEKLIFDEVKLVETVKGQKRPKIVYEVWVKPPMYGKLSSKG